MHERHLSDHTLKVCMLTRPNSGVGYSKPQSLPSALNACMLTKATIWTFGLNGHQAQQGLQATAAHICLISLLLLVAINAVPNPDLLGAHRGQDVEVAPVDLQSATSLIHCSEPVRAHQGQ